MDTSKIIEAYVAQVRLEREAERAEQRRKYAERLKELESDRKSLARFLNRG